MLIELGTCPTDGTELVSCRHIRQFERSLFASGEETSIGLMLRAGAAVVRAIEETWPDLAPGEERAGSVLVLCGPGLNGGDGYVVARLLHEKGWPVSVIGLGDPSRQPAEAAAARQRWLNAGGEVEDMPDPDGEPPDGMGETGADILVDAIFGTGGRHPIPLGWQEVLTEFARDCDHLVCVDGHSALDLDTGEADGRPPPADLTVTFHRARTGHVLGAGPVLSGRVLVADIGLRNAWIRFCQERQRLSIARFRGREEPPEGSDLAKAPLRHKYDHGHALVLSGGSDRAGAARLVARAALRIGAGLVTLVLPDGRGMVPAGPDALMRRVATGPDELASLLDDERVTAICLGPGLGLARARAMVTAALGHSRAGMFMPYSEQRHLAFVLDADALTAFAENPRALHDLCGHRKVVLTPHAGEFARIFPKQAEGSYDSLIERVQAAAREAGCTVLHKGAATVVASPTGRTRVIGTADAPWLATAGAGDVLAGMITGLLARGYPPPYAAETAVWLHAAAARRFGPGLIADDLPEVLPAVLRDLGA